VIDLNQPNEERVREARAQVPDLLWQRIGVFFMSDREHSVNEVDELLLVLREMYQAPEHDPR
jgi:hypothetical protein